MLPWVLLLKYFSEEPQHEQLGLGERFAAAKSEAIQLVRPLELRSASDNPARKLSGQVSAEPSPIGPKISRNAVSTIYESYRACDQALWSELDFQVDCC
jgi:hypothetical protein